MFMVCSITQALILNSALTSLSHSRIYAPNSVTKVVGVRTTRVRKWNMAVNNSGENNSVTTTTTSFDDNNVVDSASNVVRNFYDGINSHDVDSVQYLIAENCVYEDLVFPSPFVGRKEIIEFFKKFTESTSIDLQFVIDDLSTEDSSSVGWTAKAALHLLGGGNGTCNVLIAILIMWRMTRLECNVRILGRYHVGILPHVPLHLLELGPVRNSRISKDARGLEFGFTVVEGDREVREVREGC
ncbi:hypothetical protein TSUD_169180 [Trifolium subterraneum]|nr:hypothetical protein TSUD_169180 [Trifolium subterraneum]